MSPHRAVLVDFVKKHGWTRGAELGVDKGVLFNMLLTSCPQLSMVGVDTFPVPHRRERCLRMVEEFNGRAQLLEMTTHQAAQRVPEQSFDFIFIDADHADASVAEDITDWTPKVKRGGWLGGHDYNKHFPGVVSAVNRVFGKRVEQLPGSIWGVWVT
jgi:hypothetical protein